MHYSWNFRIVWVYASFIWEGVYNTAYISARAIVTSTILGLFVAVGLVSGGAATRKACRWFVEFFRNTPLLIQLYLIYFGLGTYNIDVPAFWATVVALTLNSGAYLAEIFRAGIEAIPTGHIDAAQSLGLTAAGTYWHIIIPQALRIVLPPITNQNILTVLGSSMGAVIGVVELTHQTRRVEAITFRAFEMYIAVGVLYIVLTKAMLMCFRYGEKRYMRW